MKNAMQLKAIIKNIAKNKNISAALVLQNYMLERFLERVSLSRYHDNYIIKGGFLIASMVGLDSRATMDMDATIKGYPVNEEAIRKMVEDIIAVPVEDAIHFCLKSVREIREGDEYTGYRVALTADYEKMAVPLKLDITTGDKITPREIEYSYKLMMEDRSIRVLAYNLSTILAEKLETVVSRGYQNTRPRDVRLPYMCYSGEYRERKNSLCVKVKFTTNIHSTKEVFRCGYYNTGYAFSPSSHSLCCPPWCHQNSD